MDKLKLYRAVVSILDGRGHEGSIDEEYSGRGMSGETVPAIVTGVSGLLIGWAVCMAFAEAGKIDSEWPADSLSEALKLIPTRIDNMGREYVYY